MNPHFCEKQIKKKNIQNIPFISFYIKFILALVIMALIWIANVHNIIYKYYDLK